MSELVSEILLRLAKGGAALILAIVLYAILVGPLGVVGGAPLALLCWVAAAAFVLLVETSPL